MFFLKLLTLMMIMLHTGKVYGGKNILLMPTKGFYGETTGNGVMYNPNQKCGGCSPGGSAVDTVLTIGDPGSKGIYIAEKAAVDAKNAVDVQQSLSEEAAKCAKTKLAEIAVQAAQSAEAALAGKQQVVEQIEKDLHNAKRQVENEMKDLAAAQINIKLVTESVNDVKAQLSLLTIGLNDAERNLKTAQSTLYAAQNDYLYKRQIAIESLERVNQLRQILVTAKREYESIRQSARNAACAAVTAEGNICTRTS